MPNEVLIVDDEADIRDLIGGILEDEGFIARFAANSDDALEAFRERRPNLVILDVWLQGSKLDGLEILSTIQSMDSSIPVVLISGHGTIETAVNALKRGAYDYIEKPFTSERLLLIVQRALENAKLLSENNLLKLKSGASDELVGNSAIMQHLRSTIEKVAPMNSRILISGPSGSGKEVVARLIHKKSNRQEGPFVAINSSSIAPENMEVELFGEETSDGRPIKIGVFERAHNGTLFLDEVVEMPFETQTKILRVLVEQKFKRVNGSHFIEVDVRVISSTAKDLNYAIESGRFRDDLYHRLNVVPIKVPSLEERRDDIPSLVEHFVQRIAQANGIQTRSFTAEAMAALQTSKWPGNVRELRNNIERILILNRDVTTGPIGVEGLGLDNINYGDSADKTGMHQMVSLPLREARELFEKEYLNAQIARFGGNISKTAAFIGMERSALHRKLKTLGVDSLRNNENEG